MDDNEFQRLVDSELDKLYRALTVEFEEPPGKFVVSPNAPVKQVWVSAHVRSFKLDWSAEAQAFVHPGGQTLRELMGECVSKQIGEEVNL